MARESYFATPPADGAEEFGLAREPLLSGTLNSCPSHLAERIALLDDPASAHAPKSFSLQAIQARPSGPAGTMFLWSIEAEADTLGDPFAPSARRTPSAGLVLTRPPGEYSLDWFGVAVTAPIH
jgi:hypothetical protein